MRIAFTSVTSSPWDWPMRAGCRGFRTRCEAGCRRSWIGRTSELETALPRLPPGEEEAEGGFEQIDAPGQFRIFGEALRHRADRLRPAVPEERVPARLEQPHDAVADQKQSAAFEQSSSYWIWFHKTSERESEPPKFLPMRDGKAFENLPPPCTYAEID